MVKINTSKKSTWCPGCFNFQILGGINNFLSKKIKSNSDKNKWGIVTGIGCHAKIFDSLDLGGINSLHGRPLPTALGMKIANPKINVLAFSGDGDAYSEGLEHFVHMCRDNADVKYIVHNNQVFALTVGQPTPVTEIGFKDKSTPKGVKLKPLNPLKLALSSGAGFVARVFADVNQVEKVLEEAFKYKGFAFIEIIQPCIIFHPDSGFKEKTYNLQSKKHDISNWEKAMKKAQEFNYDGIDKKTKIPLGIFYKKERKTFEEMVNSNE